MRLLLLSCCESLVLDWSVLKQGLHSAEGFIRCVALAEMLLVCTHANFLSCVYMCPRYPCNANRPVGQQTSQHVSKPFDRIEFPRRSDYFARTLHLTTSVAEHLSRRSHVSVANHVWTFSNMLSVPSNTSNTSNTMKTVVTRPTQISTHAYLMPVAILAKHTMNSRVVLGHWFGSTMCLKWSQNNAQLFVCFVTVSRPLNVYQGGNWNILESCCFSVSRFICTLFWSVFGSVYCRLIMSLAKRMAVMGGVCLASKSNITRCHTMELSRRGRCFYKVSENEQNNHIVCILSLQKPCIFVF